MASSREFGQVGEVFVERLDHIYHPVLDQARRNPLELLPKYLSRPPFLEREREEIWPSIRLPPGVRVEGASCTFTESGAIFSAGTMTDASLALVGVGAFRCIFSRSNARDFSRKIVLFGSTLRRLNRYRNRLPFEVALSVDDITDGSARSKITVLGFVRSSIVASAVTVGGLATFLAQYADAKAGLSEVLEDAGLIARIVEPVEQQMCEVDLLEE